jgi:hypothetical protein
VLFVTGRLAEPALRRVLAGMAPPFACDVAVLKITVAALMTTTWIARHLTCGRTWSVRAVKATRTSEAAGAVEGPTDVGIKHFGRPRRRRLRHVGHRDPGWISNAPRSLRGDSAGRHYRASGADIIDIRCTLACPQLAPSCANCRGRMRVGGHFDADDSHRGRAGASLVPV